MGSSGTGVRGFVWCRSLRGSELIGGFLVTIVIENETAKTLQYSFYGEYRRDFALGFPHDFKSTTRQEKLSVEPHDLA